MLRQIPLSPLVLLLAATSASAHHSPAMFRMQEQVNMTGTVREFQWTNPHSYIQLLVAGADGKEVEWSLEMAGPTYLYNNGWRPSTLKAGDKVVVTMSPLVSGANGGLVLEVNSIDGRKLGTGKLEAGK
jgi:hypothetical protein